MDTLMILALLLPLLLALLILSPTSRRNAERLAFLAPLPSLLLALAAPTGLVLDAPWLLLGSRFILDETGRLFLGFTALVWLFSSVYARNYLAGDERRHVFQAFFLATQVGNLGVCLAADAASFYLFFAIMTFAAYGLVVHTGSPEARRAGRVYIIMAVLGEAALVMGMLLAVRAAGSHYLVDLATSSPPVLAVALLVVGFGVKVGAPLLHMWLPLAHPVAPTPASAVLSGVMLKAGLLGWLRFLPLGSLALPEIGAAMMMAGLAALFLGVAAGLCQREAKALLAYSSISQMGFMTLGVGAGLLAPERWPVLLPAVVFYAAHHALAKSALFLGVGVARTQDGRTWVLVGLALPALALSGAPLTSGMSAKLELKAALAGLPIAWDGQLPVLLSLAALGTTLLMARLLVLVMGESARGSGRGLAWPWWGLIVLGLLLPWGLVPAPPLVLSMDSLLAAATPVLAGIFLAALAWRGRLKPVDLPAGDLVLPLERGVGWVWRGISTPIC